MPVTWIEHKGKRILFADYNGIKDQQALIEHANLTFKMLRESPARHLLFIADYSNSACGSDFMADIKVRAAELLKVKSLTSAIVGITGIKMILFKAYTAVTGSKARLFRTLDEAKNFVIS
jgi:hypothetical protein